MKIKLTKYLFKGTQPLTIRGILLLTFISSSMLLLPACTSNDSKVQDSTQTSVQDVSNSVASEALKLLSDTDKALSLEGYGAQGALADEDMSILDMLTYAVQDEYLAHGEYQAIINQFGSQKPYENIIRSEETHLALLKDVYDAYALDYPADDSADHIIVPDSLLEAAKTGVKAEIDNIDMYTTFLTHDLPEDIREVFNTLKSGSDSHLLAFQKQVDALK